MKRAPLAAGDLYDGALLKAVVSADPAFWTAHAELADQLQAVASSLEAPPPHLAAAIAAFDERRG